MDQSIGLNGPIIGLLPQYLYEFRKGVRTLFMLTMSALEAAQVQKRLDREDIEHYVHRPSDTKANVFFGRAPCVAMARTIVTKPLSALSAEEDFILGTLLGYDREQQCQRYLTRRGRPPAERAG